MILHILQCNIRSGQKTIDSGRHSDLEIPPKGSILNHRGKRILILEELVSLTPSKVANLHSTYIQQIKDLKEAGAISEDRLVKQRDVLLSNMVKLQ